MEGRRIKKSVIIIGYSVALVLLLGSLYLIELSQNNKTFEKEERQLTYVSKVIFDDTISVVANTTPVIEKPFTDEKVTVAKNYYDYKKEEKNQQNAIIYYENTYMQSTGISYTSTEPFAVTAVADGTVTKISEDELLGKIVEITHANGLVSVYESLSEVEVKENDVVTSLTTIGTSGNCNLQKDVANNLYFELLLNKENINPEEYYGKQIADLKG